MGKKVGRSSGGEPERAEKSALALRFTERK